MITTTSTYASTILDNVPETTTKMLPSLLVASFSPYLYNNITNITNYSNNINVSELYIKDTTIINGFNINNNSNNSNFIIKSIKNNENYLKFTWSKGLAVTIFIFLILITIIGNTLVIISFFTTRRLRTVTNCFVMNLAITDWLVGTCVMPPAVVLYILGSWQFGWILCDIWISLDVLLCTASILSLCAISLDRYLAVIQPLTYSKKRRSKRLAMFMIIIVWIVAFSITCPPFFGWYEQGRRKSEIVDCRYNQNKGYVVFSAMGSFFLPATVMIYVYLNIGCTLSSRRQRINLTEASEKAAEIDIDCENYVTESENDQMNKIHNNQHNQCYYCDSSSIKLSFSIKYKSKTFDNNLSSHCHHHHYHSHHHNIKNHNKNKFISKNNSDGGNGNVSCGNGDNNDIDNIINSNTLQELVHISKSIPCATITGLRCDITTNNKCPNCCVRCGYRQIKNPGNRLIQNEISSSGSNLPSTSSNNVNNNNNNINSNSNYHRNSTNQEHIQMDNIHFNHTTYSDPNLSKYKIYNNHDNCHHSIPHESCIGHHHYFHQKTQRIPPMRISTQKQTKTTKTLTVVMGGFIICWLPFFTYYIMIPFLNTDIISETLMLFLTWVGWVNCAINPFIYAFYNPDFRLAFWRLTFRRCFKPNNHLAMFKG